MTQRSLEKKDKCRIVRGVTLCMCLSTAVFARSHQVALDTKKSKRPRGLCPCNAAWWPSKMHKKGGKRSV